jgi:hypothetical protein
MAQIALDIAHDPFAGDLRFQDRPFRNAAA